MCRIKLAAVLIMLPTSLCFIATAQEQLSANPARQLALLQPSDNTLASMRVRRTKQRVTQG